MPVQTTASAARIAQLLEGREKELLAVLHRTAESVEAGPGPGEVLDFKDAAIEESLARVDDAQAAQAARELVEVRAAMQRLRNGSYGECLDCGEPIEERRLRALPATPCCAGCQEAREHVQAAMQRRRAA